MDTLKANIQILNNIQGLKLVDHFVLPNIDWWKYYYNSIERNIQILRKRYEGKESYQTQLDIHQKEMEMFSRYSDCYGYVFYIIQKINE